MRIKAKIAYNHEIGPLPRGAVIEEADERAQALIAAGKFEETKDEITHKPQGDSGAVVRATRAERAAAERATQQGPQEQQEGKDA